MAGNSKGNNKIKVDRQVVVKKYIKTDDSREVAMRATPQSIKLAKKREARQARAEKQEKKKFQKVNVNVFEVSLGDNVVNGEELEKRVEIIARGLGGRALYVRDNSNVVVPLNTGEDFSVVAKKLLNEEKKDVDLSSSTPDKLSNDNSSLVTADSLTTIVENSDLVNVDNINDVNEANEANEAIENNGNLNTPFFSRKITEVKNLVTSYPKTAIAVSTTAVTVGFAGFFLFFIKLL